jgi:hypothetical protein
MRNVMSIVVCDEDARCAAVGPCVYSVGRRTRRGVDCGSSMLIKLQLEAETNGFTIIHP